MITLYFDCFSGVSGEKILGALIDCVGCYDLDEALRAVSNDKVRLSCTKTLVGGIPGVKAEIISSEETVFFDDICDTEEYKGVSELSKELFLVTGTETKKDYFVLFSILYILSKTTYDSVITSPVYDGVGDGTKENSPKAEVMEILDNCNIKTVITDSPCFVSTCSGAAILSVIAESCAMMPEGDIVKIGYGLGEDREGVSDALRLVIVSQRQREVVDVFEASLEFSSSCIQSGIYSNKGKID